LTIERLMRHLARATLNNASGKNRKQFVWLYTQHY